MHGHFVRKLQGVDWDEIPQRLVKGDLKGYTDAHISDAQEQALRTNNTKLHIDKAAESPLYRMCGDGGETITI